MIFILLIKNLINFELKLDDSKKMFLTLPFLIMKFRGIDLKILNYGLPFSNAEKYTKHVTVRNRIL